jgi:hypothetical protein
LNLVATKRPEGADATNRAHRDSHAGQDGFRCDEECHFKETRHLTNPSLDRKRDTLVEVFASALGLPGTAIPAANKN